MTLHFCVKTTWNFRRAHLHAAAGFFSKGWIEVRLTSSFQLKTYCKTYSSLHIPEAVRSSTPQLVVRSRNGRTHCHPLAHSSASLSRASQRELQKRRAAFTFSCRLREAPSAYDRPSRHLLPFAPQDRPAARTLLHERARAHRI